MKNYQICFEGPDLSGKSTAAKIVNSWLNGMGISSIYTRHPGATPLGIELRKIIENPDLSVDGKTRGLLFAADNCAYITSVLKPTLESGSWIVADRNNFISSLAYQIADGCSFDHLDNIHAATYPAAEVPKIDLLLVLNVDYDVACARRKATRTTDSNNETFEKKMMSKEFFDKVSNAYKSLSTTYANKLTKFAKCHVTIDASKPFEEMLSIIKSTIKSKLIDNAAV